MAALTMSPRHPPNHCAGVDAGWWEGSAARGGGGPEGTVNGGGRRIVVVSDEDGSFSLSSFSTIPPSTTSSLIRSEAPRGWKTDWNWWMLEAVPRKMAEPPTWMLALSICIP